MKMENVTFVSAKESTGKIAVVFSSANSKLFTYYKLFVGHDDIDVLFIRDPYYRAWYLRGISETVETWQGVIDSLNTYLMNYDNSNVLFWGSSMGGYAAIKAWQAYPQSYCFAVSPQTILDPKLPHNIDSEYWHESDRASMIDLMSAVTDRLHYICGSADLVDLFYVASSGLDPKSYYPIRGGDHLIAADLYRSGLFQSVVDMWKQDLCLGLNTLLDGRAYSLDLYYCDQSRLALVRSIVVDYYFSQLYSKCLQSLNELLAVDLNPGALMMKGHIMNKQNDLNECINCFSAATDVSISKLEPSKQLAKIFMARNMHMQAIEHLLLALSARQNDYDSLCMLGEAYFMVGLVEDSRLSLEKAKLIRPGNPRVQSIAKRLGL